MGTEKTINRGMRGFTLIELLVVISIIALLLAILMPSLRAAKKQAKSVICGSRQRQLGLFNMLFEQDNEYLPFSSFCNQSGGMGGWGGKWTYASMLMGSGEKEMGVTYPGWGYPEWDWCPDELNSTNYLEGASFDVFNCAGQKPIAVGGRGVKRQMGDQSLTIGQNQNFMILQPSTESYVRSQLKRFKPLNYKSPSGNAFLACSNGRNYVDDWRSYYDPIYNWGSLGGFHPNNSAYFLYMDGHCERHKVPVLTENDPYGMPPGGYEILKKIGWTGWALNR